MNKTSIRVIEYVRLWEDVEAASRKLVAIWQHLSEEEREKARKMVNAMSCDALPPLEMYDSEEITNVDIVVEMPRRSVA